MKRLIYFITVTFFVYIISILEVEAQTLHAIIFADSDDPYIGESVYRDFNNMSMEFSIIATANNMDIKEYYFYDADCNKKNTMRVLNNLHCKSNDVVFFYYSGHGGRAINDKSKFPQLVLGNTDSEHVPLYKINKIIKSKNPKLSITMADCCNSYNPSISAKSLPGGKVIIKGKPEKVYQKLYGNLKGNIIVASSKSGETSSALINGGAFTGAFLSELQKMVSGNSTPNWSTLLTKTKEETIRLANHTPVFDINLNNSPTQQSTSNSLIQTNNPFISALIKLSDDNSFEDQRINLIQPTLEKFFESKDAKVEIYGRNAMTLLERETAQEFLERLSTSYKLVNFSEISSKRNANGKITSLKIREIYR